MFKELTKDQQNFSSSFLTSESLDGQTKETQAWLNQNYPQDQRNQIRYLEISGKGLGGSLDLTDFVNLEELYCYDNQLTGIKFADGSLDKLRVLHVGDNNFPEQDLVLFSHLVKLEVLNLGNNNFMGSLRPLGNLVNLRSLDISDTNIDSGLIYLSDKLEGLFCQAEKKTSCQKIKDELKDYALVHDYYDFQTWRKDENLRMIPGSWPKDNVNEENKKEVKVLAVESPNKGERYVLAKEKENILKDEKEAKETRNNDILLENLAKAKDELLQITLCKLKEQENKIAEQQGTISNLQGSLEAKRKEVAELKEAKNNQEEVNKKNQALQAELTKKDEEITRLKKKLEKFESKLLKNLYYKINNETKTNTNMVNNTNNNKNNKIFILEWKGADFKDGTMRYEKFEVIAGSEKESLSFYSTFFADNIKFKKGDIYQLSTTGNFVQDSSEIIQGIDNGGHEFEKSAPSLLIKELWEKDEMNREDLDLLKREFENKKEDVDRINKDWLNAKNEIDDLKKQLNDLKIEKKNLESEKEKVDQELVSLKGSLQKEKENIKKKEQELVSSNEKTAQLQSQFNNLQSEKTKIENENITQERYIKLLREQETLKNQLKNERKNKQNLAEELEEINNQGLNETIQTRLQTKEKELHDLKITVNNKLETDSQKDALETLLEMNEQRSSFATVEGVSQSFLLPVERQLKKAKDKLVEKISSEEIEEFCQIQTEIIKLKIQLEDFQAKEKKFESYISVPPK